jgi:mannose-1-phosphate guanylyltransferase
MVADGELYAAELHGFWMDIGKPEDFLKGMGLFLNHLGRQKAVELSTGANFRGNVLMVSQTIPTDHVSNQ